MLRIVRCTTDRAHAPTITAHFARQSRRLLDGPGNAATFVGRRSDGDAERYALVTAWHGFEAMRAAIGPDVLQAPLLEPVAHLLRDVTVEHFERMDVPEIGHGGVAGVLRIYSGSIAHRNAESFYAFTRDHGWTDIGRSDGLVAGLIGRRMESDVDFVAIVTAWRSREALIEDFPGAEDRPLRMPPDEDVVAQLRIEHFDVQLPEP
jgi:heme-degrading monooxygenase HmoA